MATIKIDEPIFDAITLWYRKLLGLSNREFIKLEMTEPIIIFQKMILHMNPGQIASKKPDLSGDFALLYRHKIVSKSYKFLTCILLDNDYSVQIAGYNRYLKSERECDRLDEELVLKTSSAC